MRQVPDPKPFPLDRRRPFQGGVHLLVLVLFLTLGACSDPSPTANGPAPDATEVGVVVNSIEVTLTLFDAEDPAATTRTVELGVPDGTPVGAAVQGDRAIVPMGVVPVATVVDLSAGTVLRHVSLPDTSGATGALFVDDSTALVANPLRGTVSPVNVHTGAVAPEIPVGGYPSAFARVGDRVVVVNAELVEFVPARTGTLTVLDAASLDAVGTVELSGENPGAAVLGPDGLLYVLNGGRWGADSGSLSVVDLDQLAEVAHHGGFGALPGSLALGTDGRLFVSAWSFGVAVWDPVSAAFLRSPDDPVAPGEVASSAGVAADGQGRIYSLYPECEGASRVFRLGPGYETEAEVPVGICPAGLAFTFLDEG